MIMIIIDRDSTRNHGKGEGGGRQVVIMLLLCRVRVRDHKQHWCATCFTMQHVVCCTIQKNFPCNGCGEGLGMTPCGSPPWKIERWFYLLSGFTSIEGLPVCGLTV